MQKTPVRGMRDILPSQMLIRDYLLHLITSTAARSGFQKIETPAIEHLSNLTGGHGGENESLIFKILKRGASLTSALEALTSAKNHPSPTTEISTTPKNFPTSQNLSPDLLTDSALRYDLTVPLARFYAQNENQLTSPFKSLQIGPVWRADAPQKGRFRQFVQCDFDILGDPSILAELDVVSAGLTVLSKLSAAAGLTGLTLRLNDRRLLAAAAAHFNIPAKNIPATLIILDKADKLPKDTLISKLSATGLPATTAAAFIDFISQFTATPDLDHFLPDDPTIAPVIADLKTLISALNGLNLNSLTIIFDPTLVRGMGYYTGPIFECSADGLGSSIAGGGRYDHMIEKFGTRGPVPACGFSLGFERLLTILEDRAFTPPNPRPATALLISKHLSSSDYPQLLAHAATLRRETDSIVSIFPMANNLRHQISLLESSGYTTIKKIFSLSDLT